MPIQVEWDDPSHIVIRETYSGTWNIEDNRAERELVLSMLEGDGPMVDVIIVLAGMNFPPNIVSHFSELGSRSPLEGHPRLGKYAMVGLGSFEHKLFEVFKKVFEFQARRVILASSLEEARTLLADKRQE